MVGAVVGVQVGEGLIHLPAERRKLGVFFLFQAVFQLLYFFIGFLFETVVEGFTLVLHLLGEGGPGLFRVLHDAAGDGLDLG